VIDAMHVTAKEPEGVTYVEDDLGSVPALWCVPANATPHAVLLHSHMGGSIVGSMHAERKAAAHIAKAAGVASLIPNYRLATRTQVPRAARRHGGCLPVAAQHRSSAA
jgi:acetyl esterase/lipase